MVNFESLTNVCNGGHLYEFTYADADALRAAMRTETKAIMIVGRDQTQVLQVLRRLARKKKGFRAKQLARWSSTANLWMVRT